MVRTDWKSGHYCRDRSCLGFGGASGFGQSSQFGSAYGSQYSNQYAVANMAAAAVVVAAAATAAASEEPSVALSLAP